MNNASTSNDFFFVKSAVKSKTRKKPTYGGEGVEIPYEPWEGEEEWVEKEVREQITSTISKVKTKKLKDDERVYVVLGLSTSYNPRKDGKPAPIHIFSENVKNVLNRLSAKILAYLNIEHNRLLVSCPLSNLSKLSESKRGCNSKYFHNVKRLSPLTFKEQVSEGLRQDTEWLTITKPILIQLVPNLPTEIRHQYMMEIIKYLREILAEPVDFDDSGFIAANLSKESTTELLETSNFVFRVSEVPQGVAEKLRTSKRRTHKRSKFVVEGKNKWKTLIQNASFNQSN